MKQYDVNSSKYSNIKFFLISVFFIILLGLPSLSFGDSDHVHININMEALDLNYSKKVLILNSYHQGHPWTDGVTKGILDKFVEHDVNVEIHIENMDTKRIVDKKSWNDFLKQRLKAYPGGYLDLIIVSDDNALYTLYKIGHKYHNIPIVYCGISEDIARHSDSCSMFIGVEEYLPFKENIELGLKLFPETEHIAIVTDRSRTGATHYYTAKQTLKNIDLEDIDIIWLNGYKGINTAELNNRLGNLPENTIVLFSIWQIDGDGRFWDPVKYYPQYSKASNAPMFTVMDLGIYDAFLGGKVTVAETQGHLAAELGIQLLSGELIENLTRVSDQNIYYFNWKELNRWNIRIKDLPENAIIVNKHLTVYSQYRTFFFLTLGLIFLLFVLFWLLLLYHFRYRNYELQRTKMANKTKRLANRYNILFNQSNNAIVIFNLESGNVVAFNEKALDLFDVPKDIFQNYPLAQYFDNYNEMRDNRKNLLKAPFEIQMFKWDKSRFHAQVILNLLEEEDENFIYAIINDITIRKEQEEEIKVNKARLNETLLNSKNSYWEWDLVNNVLNKDDNFWLALNIDPSTLKEDPLDSNYYLNSVHADDLDDYVESVNDAILGKRDTILHELRMSFNGKDTWVEIRGVIAKRDENGKGLVINGFMMNIDERKHQEEELVKAKEKAEESDRLKSAFISNISHEIRTPLNGIVGFSNLLGRENLNLEEKRKYLSFINENNDLLLKLINDILEISKIEADSLNIHVESCNLFTICENILTQARINLPLTVTLTCSKSQNINVQVDKMRLTQILRNLLSNAIKFTVEGSIEMGYSIKRDMIEFYIHDTGIGIEEEMLKKVFERFVQIDPFSSGTGLGLSISKAVVEKMGGKIWLESALGKGTTVYFTVKYKKAKIDISDIEPTAISQKYEKDTKAEKLKTVLIAEDDESSYVLLNVILTEKYKIIRALTDVDILTHLKRYHPDILIVDTDMPGFTNDMIKSIRKISKTMPIVGISDNTLDFIRNKEMTDVLNDHLSKPINIKSLMEILEEQLKDQ
ncbi:MAG: ATP-binding protein [Candidatus Marinimicrobia bacterium]|nr:ATP-binding protein [Candidatus Neomarinimicrobiota bacterium]